MFLIFFYIIKAGSQIQTVALGYIGAYSTRRVNNGDVEHGFLVWFVETREHASSVDCLQLRCRQKPAHHEHQQCQMSSSYDQL